MTIQERVRKWLISALLWMWTGGIYFFIEVAWKTMRGKPEAISWTMFLLAIILSIPLERFGAELPWKMSLLLQSVICGTGIMVVEFVAGCILNLCLGLGVWDYSNLPLNLMGQVCLQFYFVWIVLSVVGIIMLDWMRYVVDGGEKPHYKLI